MFSPVACDRWEQMLEFMEKPNPSHRCYCAPRSKATLTTRSIAFS